MNTHQLLTLEHRIDSLDSKTVEYEADAIKILNIALGENENKIFLQDPTKFVEERITYLRSDGFSTSQIETILHMVEFILQCQIMDIQSNEKKYTDNKKYKIEYAHKTDVKKQFQTCVDRWKTRWTTIARKSLPEFRLWQ